MKIEGLSKLRIFLCGDVMLGRGIDQILAHPSNSQLYESFVTDARDYIHLAEEKHGKIFYPVTPNYIWGDALKVWQQQKPDVKIINLETAITESDDYLPHKAIHYRMQPRNIDVLTTADIDICTLANNHILDWGETGLIETLTTLKKSHIQFSGAGKNLAEALQPAIFHLPWGNKRVLVFSAGSHSSGILTSWQASSTAPGVYYLPHIHQDVIHPITENIKQYRQAGDLIIFSIHWGSNWGYDIPNAFRSFAHALIDEAKVDVIFGHSSHHPRPIEIYKNKPIFYGCGDFINDYEGISGYEEFRGDLSFMYFLDFDSTSLQFLKMTLAPLEIKQFRLQHANKKDCEWLLQTLNQTSLFGTQFKMNDQHYIDIII